MTHEPHPEADDNSRGNEEVPTAAVVDAVSKQGPDGDANQQGAPEAEPGPQQQEMPFAIVEGQPYTKLPQDLYIPPEALEVFLEAFEGPLDLLLYLIKRQNLDILHINVAQITHQYMEYIELMHAMRWELAAEYLVMAAMLAEIKSRSLLPRHENAEEDEGDPRTELIRRLQEYERYKQAAVDIDAVARLERDIFIGSAEPPQVEKKRALPEVTLQEMLLELAHVLKRAEMYGQHHVELERLSTRERMSTILSRLQENRFIPFVSLFTLEEGKLGVVVSFLAVMELIKESLIDVVQNELFGPIHIKAKVND